jgi:hypothetical protein
MLGKDRVELAVGYEGTQIGNGPNDVLNVTRHYEQYEADFDLQAKLGIKHLRYSINGSMVWVSPTEFDFSFFRPIIKAMLDRGFEITLDACHHKPPLQIPGGFANPDFPEYHTNFCLAIQKEWPEIKRMVVDNEPAVTAFLHSNGVWGNHNWLDVYLNKARATAMCTQALLANDPAMEFFNPEPIDHDVSGDPNDAEINGMVDFYNNWARFGWDELLAGKVDTEHGWYWHLYNHGATRAAINWFQENPAVNYNRDLDFYQHNLKVRTRNDKGDIISVTNPNPPRLSEVIQQYKERMPYMRFNIAETNIRGTVRDRITWFRYTLEECREAGIKRMAWWGLTDAYGWGGKGKWTNYIDVGEPSDPVGIYNLADDPTNGPMWIREANEFTEIVCDYAHGRIDVEDIPVYEPTPESELGQEMLGYLSHIRTLPQKAHTVFA